MTSSVKWRPPTQHAEELVDDAMVLVPMAIEAQTGKLRTILELIHADLSRRVREQVTDAQARQVRQTEATWLVWSEDELALGLLDWAREWEASR